MQMQGQGPQKLMNNIPRQTGNGQVQSFNQGSNALQNQRNLQISNQMLTQSQNIGQTLPMMQNSQSQNTGQTLPMIQNSQTNNQQLQQPQLSGFQVQPQMQMQNQVNQQLFSKQIQTQSISRL
jgi:L-cysteine desulfidase